MSQKEKVRIIHNHQLYYILRAAFRAGGAFVVLSLESCTRRCLKKRVTYYNERLRTLLEKRSFSTRPSSGASHTMIFVGDIQFISLFLFVYTPGRCVSVRAASELIRAVVISGVSSAGCRGLSAAPFVSRRVSR